MLAARAALDGSARPLDPTCSQEGGAGVLDEAGAACCERVICGDVEGTTALLRLDGSFDHFFGSSGSPEPVEVGVEIAVTEASVRPAE